MKFKILLAFLICICSVLSLKADKEDSLKLVLENTKNEHDKISVLYQLSNITSKKNPEISLDYAKKGLSIAQKYKDSSIIAEGYYNVGQAYIQMGSNGKSIENYLEAINICKKIGNNKIFCKVLNEVGVLYVLEENYSKALEYIDLAYNNSRKINDSATFGRSLMLLGWISILQKDYLNAINYLKESDHPYKEILLSEAYLGAESINQALIHANIALEKLKNVDDYNGLGEAYRVLGEIYSKKQNYRLSIEALEKSLYNFIVKSFVRFF